MAEASGIEAVVAGAVDQAKALLASERAQQLDLLALPAAEAVAEARQALGPHAAGREVLAEARRRGRPKGATNKRTDDFARWLLQFGPHPAVTMMRIQAMPAEELAAMLGCKPAEAVDRQIRCAAELLPYLEGKKPVAIDVTARGDFTLAIGGITHSEGEMEELKRLDFAPGPILEAEFDEVEQDQALSAEAGGASE